MGHADDPGDGCGGGRRKCGGNLLVDASSAKQGRRSKGGFMASLRALRSLRKAFK